VTSGAQSDIEQATRLARMMVTRWGFSPELGTVAYGENQEEVFLGMSMGRQQNISEATAQKIDTEVRRLVESGLQRRPPHPHEKRDRPREPSPAASSNTRPSRATRSANSSTASRRCADTGEPVTPVRGSPVPSAGRNRPRETDGGLEPQPQV
jgi:cell division protease FtsH